MAVAFGAQELIREMSMTRVFTFDDKRAFHSPKSTEFAELMVNSPAPVRKGLAKFGLGVQLDIDPIRTTYNGRKVGIGSFAAFDGEVHFSIATKTDTSMLKGLLEALNEDTLG